MRFLELLNHRYLPIALLFGLLVLGLSACGSDDDPTNPGPTDTTAPTMVSIDPPSRTMRVPLDVEVTVIFSEAMDTTITTEGAGFAHYETERVWWESPTELHMVPVGLPEGRQILLSIRVELKDLAGNALNDHYSIPVFTLSEDFIVLDTDPRHGSSDISRDVSPVIFFSQPPNMASLAASLSVAMVGKSADLSYTLGLLNDHDVQLDFTTELPANTQLRIYIEGETVSADGQALPVAREIFFTTGESGDETAPAVVSVDPLNSTPNVALEQTVTVVFSEAMAATGTVSLSSGSPLNSRWDSSNTFMFEMDGIAQGTTITAALNSSFTDVAGNVLDDFSWSFTTVSDDFFVSGFTPANGSDLISIDVMPILSFSQRVQTHDLGFHLIINEGGVAMNPGLYSLVQLDHNTIGINFDASLNTDTVYDFLIDDTMVNYTDVVIDHSYSYTFMTGSTGDTTGPVLLSVFPANGATVGPDLEAIVFEFSEPINHRTFEPTDFNVNGMFWILDMEESNNNQTITLHLGGTLPAGLTFEMTLGDITDMFGNGMDTLLEYGFTVAGTPDYFPVNSDWSYFTLQVMGEDEMMMTTNFHYIDYPHFARDFWVDNNDRTDDPDNRWNYLKTSDFIRFEGYGILNEFPVTPSVGWMGVSEMAGAWHDTVISFNDTGEGYLDGSLVGFEDVQYMGEGQTEGIYWGDCRHYSLEWYSTSGDTPYRVYLWDTWYAPGIGNVKEVVEQFTSEGISQGVYELHTIAVNPGLSGPLKASGDKNFWEKWQSFECPNTGRPSGKMMGFPFISTP